jgi:hypothetical protein
VKEEKEVQLDLSVKKVKKVAQVRRVIKVIKAKKATKATKDSLEHWVTRDLEVIKVCEANRVNEEKKVIWDIVVHLEIKVLLENQEVKVSQVRLDYLEIKEIKGTKAKLDQWVTKVIKER